MGPSIAQRRSTPSQFLKGNLRRGQRLTTCLLQRLTSYNKGVPQGGPQWPPLVGNFPDDYQHIRPENKLPRPQATAFIKRVSLTSVHPILHCCFKDQNIPLPSRLCRRPRIKSREKHPLQISGRGFQFFEASLRPIEVLDFFLDCLVCEERKHRKCLLILQELLWEQHSASCTRLLRR